MVRMIGICLVLAGSLGTGLCIRREQKARREELQFLAWTFTVLASEISYQVSDLAEGCLRTGEKVGQVLGGLLKEMAERLEQGIEPDFATAWQEMCSAYQKNGILKKEEYELLTSFPSYTGFMDAGVQFTAVQQFSRDWEERAQKAAGEEAEKGKLSMALCAALGIAVVLILI